MSVSRWLDRLSFAATIDELQTHVDHLDVVDETDLLRHHISALIPSMPTHPRCSLTLPARSRWGKEQR